MNDFFISETVKAALIGALVAVMTIIIKDFIGRVWMDHRDDKRKKSNIFKLYTIPLCYATMDLVWRLNEIYEQERSYSYLYIKYNTPYADYKRKSTIYRLSCLLGWLRAFNKETALLNSNNNTQLTQIKEAVNKFSSALADGNHIQNKKLEGFLFLWKEYFKGCKANDVIASSLNKEIKNYLMIKKVKSASLLSQDDKFELCKQIIKQMCQSYNIDYLDEKIILDTLSPAMVLCSFKEAWIYRDCQNAIGDLMLKVNNEEKRKYDVMGFYEFYDRISNPLQNDVFWFKQMEDLLYDLETTPNESDTRQSQLDNITLATSYLLLALTNKDKRMQILMSKTIQLSKILIYKIEKNNI